ncbi:MULTISPECIES: glycosyltransferase family 2 protein [unclassified Nostoc]|uniref:glycosyltransferase family 2 protein n=1 Tax=unclassified Nostoc TaxID=2593658 RepID=UPI002AD35198|nr:glycosyltransferase [Nostoc sp. DedQUE03]MDZ7973515.1 glycosyltransferase [Nostoc sp. DedQUE03]MDZ8047246.1 glycosyltransferase [Nostoc sp. DedQUE02]
MKVSVLMLAYNHEQFISQALDSILMQQVNFDYEIVIGEDCSKDNTRNILIGYQQKHPDKIRLLLPNTNLGMHDNFIQTFKACQGDYIAILEGDDYWTSPYKLQKQVDLLDTHLDYTICFHNALILFQDSSTNYYLSPENKKLFFTLEDILSSNLMPTASIMLRQGFVHEFPDWIYDVDLVDWTLQVLVAQHGQIGYIDEVFSVYRNHTQGNWSSKSTLEATLELAKLFEYIIKYLHLNSKHQRTARVTLSSYYCQLAVIYYQNGDKKNTNKYISKWLLNDFLSNRLLSKTSFKVSFILQIYTPILYKTVKKLKDSFLVNFGKL